MSALRSPAGEDTCTMLVLADMPGGAFVESGWNSAAGTVLNLISGGNT